MKNHKELEIFLKRQHNFIRELIKQKNENFKKNMKIDFFQMIMNGILMVI